MSQAEDFSAMKGLHRSIIRQVWEIDQEDGALAPEHYRLAKIMRDHPEYADLWGRLDSISDEELERDGTNPVLHVTIHHTIETQIFDRNPAETGQTLERLMQEGMSRHDAIHKIGTVLSDEIWHILQDTRPFDEPGYVRKLKQLKAKAIPHPQKKTGHAKPRSKKQKRSR